MIAFMGSTDVMQAVRRVLIKNWLDMGKIRLQVAGSTVILRGVIRKSRGEEPVNGLFLEQVEQQIRATKGVKQLRMHLEDWVFDRGEWRRKETEA